MGTTSISLKGFGEGRITLLDVVELPATIGIKPFKKTMMLDFK